MNEQNDRYFYQNEAPEITLSLQGGQEIRFYSGAGRLTLSRKAWKNPEGKEVLGKALNLKLKENVGNLDLIAMFEMVIEYLKGR